ncbi:M48 family metallopeptidase [Haloparvum alkalitolerans]|uniref:M48 family metallopeptidase n=1 Tax=Haloparvum alkalitolerans TaxID=1042953 RepID=UPI003CEA2D74
MRRVVVRLAMAAVGIVLLAGYLAAALLGYRALLWLWATRPDAPTLAAVLAGATLLSAYLSYRVGTSQLLAALSTDRLPRSAAPGLHRRIDDLAARMGVDRPTLYVGEMGAPNAFAVGGSDRGALVLDRSLFRLLDPAELEGIVAHELAHLERNDGLRRALAQGVVQTAAGLLTVALVPAILALSGLARGSAWIRGRPGDRRGPLSRLRRAVVAAPVLVLFAATLIARARSRRREFAADDRAVEVTGDPLALARALRRIERATETAWPLGPLSTNRETESTLERWISTHPPTEERVERLAERADAERRRRQRGRTRIPVE